MYDNADFKKCWTNYPLPPSFVDKMCLRGGGGERRGWFIFNGSVENYAVQV